MKGPYHFLFEKFWDESPEELTARAANSGSPTITRAILGMQVVAFTLLGAMPLYNIARQQTEEGSAMNTDRVIESVLEAPEGGVGLASEWIAIECLALGIGARRRNEEATAQDLSE
jgi:hypothetical protein